MRGVICYYSGSGNTRLASQYITKNITNCSFDLFNIATDGVPDLGEYYVIGLATFTDSWEPPPLMRRFIQELRPWQGMPAFVFNTYGFSSGKTLKTMSRLATDRGCTVFAGHSLHTPESYPPMIAAGHGAEDHPDVEEMQTFNAFITELDRCVSTIAQGGTVEGREFDAGKYRFVPRIPWIIAILNTGRYSLDASRCTECGTCAKVCPYDAITFGPKPIFSMRKCYTCWACYNHCPAQAIATTWYWGGVQYAQPNDHMKSVLG